MFHWSAWLRPPGGLCGRRFGRGRARARPKRRRTSRRPKSEMSSQVNPLLRPATYFEPPRRSMGYRVAALTAPNGITQLPGRESKNLLQTRRTMTAEQAKATVIVAANASKLFLDGAVTAFRQLDLEVRDRETLCIVGPSGCGKTTLLRAIAGLIDLSGGKLLLGGAPIKGPPQGVALVRALAIDPKILLMDEPFASLDAQTREILQEELLRIMERLEERKTIVFITHSIDEAILLGDRIAVMTARPGRIKEIIDLPFGRPRDVEAIRADPRYAQLRAHIWHELKAARPARAA